ncbi:ABC transporter permease [Sphaerisporangium melleum]|uniref:ABC transporter permease n=1 Tax=Sphaerisporangium melleum TaxID=321316 RepID=A0A917R5P2_9ACTN|nr:ABC transporter permease [Sphaerisporangium melleum]GGK90056.1 ABC transporter permease [Sphaerisporangium melleum]GII72574.1 ABC transporter permease [Sphaerisporangium melleum]
MIGLVRAELQKVFTTRMVWGMLALSLGFTLIGLVVLGVFAGQQGTPPLTEPDGALTLFSQAGSGLVFSFVIGTLLITGEYRFQTITHTFLATPRRERVVAAKLIACAAVGAIFGLAGTLLAFAVGVPAILIRGGSLSVIGGDVVRLCAGVVAAMALYTILGLALGSLLRNQIAAIVIGVGWVYVLENLLVVLLPGVGKWLPGGAAQAVYGLSSPMGGDYLPAWAGAALLLGYALLFAAIASATTIRRDIT